MKLYEIDAEIERIGEHAIDEETGEILDEEMFAQFDSLMLAREEKIENCCLYLKNIKSDIEQLKAEADSFAKRAKSAERRAESLKSYIKYALGGEKFKTTRVNVYYRNSESVEVSIPDEELKDKLPTEYQRVTVEANKTAIKEALAEGIEIDGCQMVSKQSIIIK